MVFFMSRTIVALATPPGVSGLAVIRMSGDESFDIISRCFVHKNKIDYTKTGRIYYGKIVDNDSVIDSVTISVFKSPKSYTGEDSIELGCHGNSILAYSIVDILVKNGATYAEPGEFTKRAFLNGKIDLIQAEAIADLIHSVNVAGITTATKQLEGKFTDRLKIMRQKLLDISSLLELELDFADEGLDLIQKSRIENEINEAIDFCSGLIAGYVSAEAGRNGYYVAIAGYPNSGKSTLFNALADKDRAIVSDQAGTTRDYLEETIYIDGIKIIVADTAGIRDTDDTIEIQGIRMVESVIKKAHLIIVLNDITVSSGNSDNLYNTFKDKYSDKEILLVQNKADLIKVDNIYSISAKYGEGIMVLRAIIAEKAVNSISLLNDLMVNSRHLQLLLTAKEHLENAQSAVKNDYENELIAIDLRKSTGILGEITGESWNEEVLANIFSRFCIGK